VESNPLVPSGTSGSTVAGSRGGLESGGQRAKWLGRPPEQVSSHYQMQECQGCQPSWRRSYAPLIQEGHQGGQGAKRIRLALLATGFPSLMTWAYSPPLWNYHDQSVEACDGVDGPRVRRTGTGEDSPRAHRIRPGNRSRNRRSNLSNRNRMADRIGFSVAFLRPLAALGCLSRFFLEAPHDFVGTTDP
jgi:hypothetical protein